MVISGGLCSFAGGLCLFVPVACFRNYVQFAEIFCFSFIILKKLKPWTIKRLTLLFFQRFFLQSLLRTILWSNNLEKSYGSFNNRLKINLSGAKWKTYFISMKGLLGSFPLSQQFETIQRQKLVFRKPKQKWNKFTVLIVILFLLLCFLSFVYFQSFLSLIYYRIQ